MGKYFVLYDNFAPNELLLIAINYSVMFIIIFIRFLAADLQAGD